MKVPTPQYRCPLGRLQPQATRETCLLYLPGHPAKALRQYPSLAALGQALTQMLWHDEQRRRQLPADTPVREAHRRLRQRGTQAAWGRGEVHGRARAHP